MSNEKFINLQLKLLPELNKKLGILAIQLSKGKAELAIEILKAGISSLEKK